MLTIGLVGCGVIGSRLASEIQNRFRTKARLIGVCDKEPHKARLLGRTLRPPVPVLTKKQIVSRSRLILETASAQAVGEILPEIVKQRKALLTLSASGLLRYPRLLQKAVKAQIPLYVPSGALAGLDGVKAGRVGKLISVTLKTRKPPRALIGAPGVGKMNLLSLKRPRLIFSGSASRAISLFPQNINVAATLALAGIGAKRTRVQIIADPSLRTNIHEITVVGQFGRLIARTENRPSKENPKTSQLAVDSAVTTLRQILDPFRIGT
ncbi:MAG: DUF108 domain-containing protein [Candidatus Omnitrophica bacterium]|nr:DUF108 domain-containing protein [Candidatus Omnitrophota bacterium]